jgi:hypothetical protein
LPYNEKPGDLHEHFRNGGTLADAPKPKMSTNEIIKKSMELLADERVLPQLSNKAWEDVGLIPKPKNGKRP